MKENIAYEEILCGDCGDTIPKGGSYFELGDGGEYSLIVCASCKIEMV